MRRFYQTIFTFLCLVVSMGSVYAQKNYFSEVGERAALMQSAERVIIPQNYQVLKLNNPDLKSFLWSLPEETAAFQNRSSTPLLALPMPDGSIATFHVWQSSIQEPGLEAKFPNIKTFAGQGITDPSATIRFDYTERGFHAQVLTSNDNGTYYIDPYAIGDVEHYISYFRKDLNKARFMQCEVPGSAGLEIPRPNGTEAITAACRGTNLYVYRLAIACTGEYAQAIGVASGTNPALLHSVIVTTANRVNGIYEKELAIRLVLIANNTDIEFLDATTDPFTGNDNANILINESQTVITNIIGSANFDIGHTFSTGGGGLAGLGVVCNTSNKARGITGSSRPTGDGYDIDYVAHEIGHQFGGSHTFNSTSSNCGGGNRSAASAYEVGSGTTIQGYAGICGSDNIQLNSDPVFHPRSFDQISDFVEAGGASCRTVIATGNILPVATILTPSGLTIPSSTPFTLSGTGTDANGDVLTYSWEQWDLGAASTWNGGNAASPTSPLFKSRLPKTTGERTFPDIAVILANYPTNPPATMGGLKGETLPTDTRVMNFRFTVRDNRANGGGVTSVGSGGCQSSTPFILNSFGTTPFNVSIPNGGESYAGGSTQTITWNNASTSVAPFNVPNVKISLSVDGGFTYPTVILASTPNDGSESVIIPVGVTSTARIKVEAIGNIFFDISNANFLITAPVSEFNLSATTPSAIACGSSTSSSTTISSTTTANFNSPITLSATGVPAGATITFASNPIAAGGSTVATLNNTNNLAFGTYNVTIIGTGGPITKSVVVNFVVSQGPAIVLTLNPADQMVCAGSNATFTALATGVVTYQWQVSMAGAPFTNIAGATGPSYTVVNTIVAQTGNRYRVVISSNCFPTGVTSTAATLTVNPIVVITAQPTSVSSCAESSASFSVAATGGNISYQWQVSVNGGVFTNLTNTAPYSGVNTATLTVNPLTVSLTGNIYRVVVGAAPCGVVNSNPVTLIVNPLPTSVVLTATTVMSSSPAATSSSSPGAQVILSVIASPAGSYSYAWFRDNMMIPVTTASYQLDANDVGTYHVIATNTNTGCSRRSNDVTITSSPNSNLFVYPNPNNGTFQVRYYNASNASIDRTINVYDSKGARVFSKKYTIAPGPYARMDVSLRRPTAKAVYIVELRDANGKLVATSRILVN